MGALFGLSSASVNSTNGQLIDNFTNNIRSLKSLQELVDQWSSDALVGVQN